MHKYASLRNDSRRGSRTALSRQRTPGSNAAASDPLLEVVGGEFECQHGAVCLPQILNRILDARLTRQPGPLIRRQAAGEMPTIRLKVLVKCGWSENPQLRAISLSDLLVDTIISRARFKRYRRR
jgi:hypothetical protein